MTTGEAVGDVELCGAAVGAATEEGRDVDEEEGPVRRRMPLVVAIRSERAVLMRWYTADALAGYAVEAIPLLLYPISLVNRIRR